MIWAGIAFAIFLGGCVPIQLYQDQQKKLSSINAERNNLTKELKKCDKQNKDLVDALKAKPTTTIIEKQVAEPLKPEELDEIKRQALQEAERKFKLRMGTQKIE